MICKKIDLYKYCSVPRGKNEGGYLTLYCYDKENEISVRTRPAMLVLPGGAYQFCSEREKEPIAMQYFIAGYQAFVLDYTVKAAFPTPLLEAAMAMVYIRENAKKLRVDQSHVAAIGFSAGGHLCGMLATLFADEALKNALGKRVELVRPDAVVLCYGVLTSLPKYGDFTTINTISGGDEELRKKLSPEKCVKNDSAPAFLWHTTQDAAVPVQCSIMYASACLEHGVPFEMHLFEQGWHGLSAINANTHIDAEVPENLARNAEWIELSRSWLKMRGFVVTEPAK